jgi:hypothetical protein
MEFLLSYKSYYATNTLYDLWRMHIPMVGHVHISIYLIIKQYPSVIQ